MLHLALQADTRVTSADPFQIRSGLRHPGGHTPQLPVVGTILDGSGDVLGGASQAEQAILQLGKLASREHNGVVGKTAPLHGSTAFVGALSARLRTVLARAPLTRARHATSAPAAVPDGALRSGSRIGLRHDVHGG
jgi:hypothetical protein